MIINDIKDFNADKVLQCVKNKEMVEFKNKILILASASKSRNDILKNANIDFVVIPNTLDEEAIKNSFERNDSIEKAEEYVKSLSKAKALTIAPYIKNGVILSADTVAFYENEILEKPKDEADARRIFNKISGTSHVTITGVCIIDGTKIDNFAVTSPITMIKIPENKIEELVKEKNTYSYAGGYRIDQNFYGYAKFAQRDFNNILGLPIEIIKEKIKCIM